MPITLNGDGASVSANSIILGGSTSGTITIIAPDVAGSAVLTLPKSGGKIGTSHQTEIDFGSSGLESNTYVITDTTVIANSIITGQVAYEAPTGKDLDELDMDVFDLKFAPGAGQFTLHISTLDGNLVADKFKINYTIG